MELQILFLSISVCIEFSLHAIVHAFLFLKLCNQLLKVKRLIQFLTYNYSQFPFRLASTRVHWSFSSLQQGLPQIFHSSPSILLPSQQAGFTALCGLLHSMIVVLSLHQNSSLDCHQWPLLIAKVSIKFWASHYLLYLEWSLAFVFLFLFRRNFFFDYRNAVKHIHHVTNNNGHLWGSCLVNFFRRHRWAIVDGLADL